MSYIVRTRKAEKIYAKYKKEPHTGCDFCKLKVGDGQAIKEFKYHWLAKARFPYDFWDSCAVLEHLMIVPKRHVQSLKEYNSEEREEYFDLLAKYESEGYSIYSRGVDVTTRTMPHVHTHLIKHGEHKRMVFYVRKPHITVFI